MDKIVPRMFSSRLLISESPLQVLPSLAVTVGLNEAIVLQQIHYWISNELNKNIKNGRVWTYNTYDDWKKQFPFWNKRAIQVLLLSLQSKKLVIAGCFNDSCWDKTKWYTIDYEVLESLNVGNEKYCEIDSAKSEPCDSANFEPSQGAKSEPSLTEITTKISTDIKKINKKNFDAEFEEFWEAYAKKVGRHGCVDIYNKILKGAGVELHKTIIQAITGQNKEREVSEELGEWTPLKKQPKSWLNGRHWEDSFRTEGEVREENRRSVSKLSRPIRPNKADQQHNIITQFREAAERRIAELDREEADIAREEAEIAREEAAKGTEDD